MNKNDCVSCNGSTRDLLEQYLENIEGDFQGYEIPRPDTIHKAELKCKWCGRFVCWIPKEPEEKKRWQTPEIEANECQVCRTLKGDLGDGDTLHNHHLDGNPKNNSPFNMLVACTSCHAIIHHQITYRGHFVKKINRIINCQQ